MKIAFLGDVALVGQFDSTVTEDIEARVRYLQEILSEYDFVVANLESPLTDRQTSFIPKSMHLKAEPNCVRVLKLLGVNAVTLANNHTYDYGRKGLEDTLRVLDDAGIIWYGVDGVSRAVDICGEKVDLSGFCCLSANGVGYRGGNGKGINMLTRGNIEKQIDRDKSEGAVSIVSVHFGMEHTNYPALEHVHLFEDLCKRNTLVIHGHHPHQIQGIEKVHSSLIAYSLGNALFDKTESINGSFTLDLNEANRKSFVLGVDIEDGQIVDHKVRGFCIGRDGIQAMDIEPELSELSSALCNVSDAEEYQKIRQKQFETVIQNKFGKHDLRWLLSRLNYYSIGAKVSGAIKSERYKRVKGEF